MTIKRVSYAAWVVMDSDDYIYYRTKHDGNVIERRLVDYTDSIMNESVASNTLFSSKSDATKFLKAIGPQPQKQLAVRAVDIDIVFRGGNRKVRGK